MVGAVPDPGRPRFVVDQKVLIAAVAEQRKGAVKARKFFDKPPGPIEVLVEGVKQSI